MSKILKDATARPWIVTDKTLIGSTHLPHDMEPSEWYDQISKGDDPDTHFVAETATHDLYSQNEANARLIVTAVNAYEPMLAALEASQEFILKVCNQKDWSVDEISEVMISNSAAIALAKLEGEKP